MSHVQCNVSLIRLWCSFSFYQDQDFEEMIVTAQLMENQYSHFFDLVIVNDDLASAFAKLRQALRKVEAETHWVPVSWTHS